MEKFRNKYRTQSIHLQNWDYRWNAAYFVTICTKKREHFFGKIIDQKMQLSEIGKLAHKYWYQIPQHFPFVILGAFVVMPNHIHGIIIINHDGSTEAINRTSTESKSKNIGGFAGNKNPMVSKNLSTIIRWYKGRITFESRKSNPDFAWQPRYYEHIIRNTKSYLRIKQIHPTKSPKLESPIIPYYFFIIPVQPRFIAAV